MAWTFSEDDKVIEERIKLETNSQGHPVLVRSGDQEIEILISEDSGSGVTDVELIGDAAALRRLGEVLIGVSSSKGYHVHLESNPETSVINIEPNSIRLTISNSETPPQTKSSSPPPDWARG